MPYGIQVLLAGLFAQVSKVNKTDSSVSSKQVEDFRITFNVDNNLDDEFRNKYSTFISKYSMCNIGNLRHESKCHGRI